VIMASVYLVVELASSAPLGRKLQGARSYSAYKKDWTAYSTVPGNGEAPPCPFSRRTPLCFDQDLVACPWAGYQSTCTKPPTVLFGTVTCTPGATEINPAAVTNSSNKFAVGATCTTSCNTGYTLHGSSSWSCNRQGLTDCSWDGNSDWVGSGNACCNTACEAYTSATNSCGKFMCPTKPAVAGGTWTYAGGTFGERTCSATATLSCDSSCYDPTGTMSSNTASCVKKTAIGDASSATPRRACWA
jgi:hypothetical protein